MIVVQLWVKKMCKLFRVSAVIFLIGAVVVAEFILLDVGSDSFPVEGDGYVFSEGVESGVKDMVVRVAVGFPDVLRGDVRDAARKVNEYSGARIRWGDEWVPGSEIRDGEIVFEVGNFSLCDLFESEEVLGCADVVFGGDDVRHVRHARVRLEESILDSSLRSLVVFHEMGHAIGLGHYVGERKRMQIMEPSLAMKPIGRKGFYMPGDVRGMRELMRLADENDLSFVQKNGRFPVVE